ncbi:MAG: type I-C CRISPR-associated endonuclease Cas1c [Calditrichia bacterium]
MSTIYLVSNRGKLARQGKKLVLHLDEHTARSIFPFKTEQLVLIGNIEITSPALKLLMHHRINTVFINKNGKFNGRLDFQAGKNVFLRQKQFKLLEDDSFRLNFARQLVEHKLQNQLTFSQRLIRNQPQLASFNPQIQQLKQLITKCQEADNLDRLRGYEGSGARAFFSVFPKAIRADFARFNGRSMNPPQDNVNAVLSFLYTLLYYRVEAALQTEGLDSSVGYFHRVDYGKCALAFDLMEEYRTPIADTLTAALFNLGTLKEEDFREITFQAEDDEYPLDLETTEEGTAAAASRGVLLTPDGIRKVIPQFEKKLDTTIFYPPAQKPLSYRQIIRQQILHFKRVIQGEESQYRPFTIK